MTLRAIVIGAGWAGEGHIIGLRDAGVEVVALCGRTPEPAYKRAAQLGVEQVRFDWRSAVEEFRPDIVTIATPAVERRAMVELAAQQGCHVVCEKPLATTVSDAKAMVVTVEQARVKHGYAATHVYAPTILHTQLLLAQGLIGQVHEIESTLHFNFSAILPYSWFNRLDQGGGLMNNLFTHKLAQVLRATGGVVQAAMGETRQLHSRAPVGPPIHDIRELFSLLGTWDPTQATEWRPVDGDSAYTVTIQLRMADGALANALFRGSFLGSTQPPETLTFHGAAGSLVMSGGLGTDERIQAFLNARQSWEEVPIPQTLLAALPPGQDSVQRVWNHFFREFVGHVRGEAYTSYPTFHDGQLAVEVIDIARTGRSWTAVSTKN